MADKDLYRPWTCCLDSIVKDTLETSEWVTKHCSWRSTILVLKSWA